MPFNIAYRPIVRVRRQSSAAAKA